MITIFISGCANTHIANNELMNQQAREKANAATITPQVAVQSALERLNQAKQDELAFYAPLHFRKASEALEKAQGNLNKKDSDLLVLEEAFKVNSLLNAGYQTKSTVESSLARALEHKRVLEDLGVPEVLPGDYQDAIGDLEDLFKEIEGGNLEKAAKGESEVLKTMTEVEIDALKKIHLTSVEAMVDKADSIDAGEFAEKTFEKANTALDQAIAFIEKNYRDREGVKSVAFEAMNAAKHAYFISKESEQLVNINAEKGEQKALYFESLLERINQPLAVPGLETMSLYDQSVTLANKVEKLTGQPISKIEVGSSDVESKNQESTPVPLVSNTDVEAKN